tara:strand:+ start:73 stop:537 length:465 start_codon:yes stop_codon:yes gene_type:complete
LKIGDEILLKKYGEIRDLLKLRKFYKNMSQRRSIAALLSEKITTIIMIDGEVNTVYVEITEDKSKEKLVYAIPIECVEDTSDPNYFKKKVKILEKNHAKQLANLRRKIRDADKSLTSLVVSLNDLVAKYVSTASQNGLNDDLEQFEEEFNNILN